MPLSNSTLATTTHFQATSNSLASSFASEPRQRLLRFPLGQEDSALLPLEQIAEVLRINATEILPIPEMLNGVLGICNWRGEMIWLVDLNHLVGYSSPLVPDQEFISFMVIVVQMDDQAIGLAVQQVDDIELHDLHQLQPAIPGIFSPSLLPFVRGVLPEVKGAVLDAAAIIQCPLWQQKGGTA